jgi:murein L,D-transpeptidase YafK
VLVVRGTHTATILAVFQWRYQYIMDISNTSKGQSINLNYFGKIAMILWDLRHIVYYCVYFWTVWTLFDLNSYVFLVW